VSQRSQGSGTGFVAGVAGFRRRPMWRYCSRVEPTLDHCRRTHTAALSAACAAMMLMCMKDVSHGQQTGGTRLRWRRYARQHRYSDLASELTLRLDEFAMRGVQWQPIAQSRELNGYKVGRAGASDLMLGPGCDEASHKAFDEIERISACLLQRPAHAHRPWSYGCGD